MLVVAFVGVLSINVVVSRGAIPRAVLTSLKWGGGVQVVALVGAAVVQTSIVLGCGAIAAVSGYVVLTALLGARAGYQFNHLFVRASNCKFLSLLGVVVARTSFSIPTYAVLFAAVGAVEYAVRLVLMPPPPSAAGLALTPVPALPLLVVAAMPPIRVRTRLAAGLDPQLRLDYEYDPDDQSLEVTHEAGPSLRTGSDPDETHLILLDPEGGDLEFDGDVDPDRLSELVETPSVRTEELPAVPGDTLGVVIDDVDPDHRAVVLLQRDLTPLSSVPAIPPQRTVVLDRFTVREQT